MGRVNRRIGKSSETANVTADGTGGGVLDTFLQEYFNRSGNAFNQPGSGAVIGMSATGGVVSDYSEGGAVYRTHVFRSSGIFSVSSLGEGSPTSDAVEYLVVAGGGEGGAFLLGALGAVKYPCVGAGSVVDSSSKILSHCSLTRSFVSLVASLSSDEEDESSWL